MWKRKDITPEMVLKTIVNRHIYQPSAVDLVIAMTGAPEKVVYAAFMREDIADRIEYGTSIRFPWVTQKGYEYLNKGVR